MCESSTHDRVRAVLRIDLLIEVGAGSKERRTVVHDRADHPAPLTIRKVLGHLGLRTEPLELSLARPPTQTRFA